MDCKVLLVRVNKICETAKALLCGLAILLMTVPMRENPSRAMQQGFCVSARDIVMSELKNKCVAVLSDSYKLYLSKCVSDNPDPLYTASEDLLFKKFPHMEFTVILRGDGLRYDVVYIEMPDGKTIWLNLYQIRIIRGSLRNVKKRGRIFMGKTSLMGAVAHGIKTGKAFRGR